MKLSKLLAGLAVAASLISGAAQAEYVVNGTFSDPSFSSQTGWSVSSNAYFFSGNAYHEGNVGGSGVIQQLVSGGNGQLTLSYDFGANSGYQETYWNGVLLATIGVSPITYYQFTVMGTGSDLLQFFGRNDPSYNALSNVSVIPEPDMLLLMATALGLVGVASRRKSKQAA